MCLGQLFYLFKQDKWTTKFSYLEAENEKLKTEKLPQDEELQHLRVQISRPKISLSASKWDERQSSEL